MPVADVISEPFSEPYFYDITDLVHLLHFETHECKHRCSLLFGWNPGLCACELCTQVLSQHQAGRQLQ